VIGRGKNLERFGINVETLWKVLAGMVGGTAIGGVLALLLYLGFDYLGNVEAGPLATLVGVLLGGVYGGAAGRGVRGTITGVIIGASAGVMLGDSVSNGSSSSDGFSILPDLPGLGTTETISALKSFVLGMITGGTVGTIMGAVPRERS
jgi:hypothetical protein